MYRNSSCFRIQLSVSLASFSIWEMTGTVRTTLSLLMSPAKLTPALGIKGFHRDMSNALHAAAVCIGRFESWTPQTWECGSASAVWRLKWGAGMWKRMWLKKRAERKVGKQEWRRGREKERGGGRTETHALCKCNWLLCISVPPTDSDAEFFYLSSPRGRMWENDGFKGEKGTNRDMETNRNMKWKQKKINEKGTTEKTKTKRKIDFIVFDRCYSL